MPLEQSKNLKLSSVEGIDFNKLRIVLRSNWLWIFLIFVVCNSAAYLTIRYTKNLFESESELKLEVKTDATELGIKSIVEDKNLNFISGEIEIIQSKLFLSRVLDSTNLNVTFYSIGHLLNTDLYGNPPAFVEYRIKDKSVYNVPFYFKPLEGNKFSLQFNENGIEINGRYGKKIELDGVELQLIENKKFEKGDEIGYSFTINSREVLLDYLLKSLTAEPLNFRANTVRLSFKDNNAIKGQAILNRIDTIYLQYSNEQKNLANKQKIDWLSNELKQIEKRMAGFEDYFENFTLQNKTNNMDEDLKRTIIMINRIDSQRFELTKKVNEVNQLLDKLYTGDMAFSLLQRQILPSYLNKNLEDLQKLYLDVDRLKLSYNEITFAYRQKEQEIESLKSKIFNQVLSFKADWLKALQELNQKKKSLENAFADMPDKSTQFSKNQRFYKLNEQFYLTLMKSKSEFEIAQAGSVPDFKILSPATLPQNPISPKKLVILGIGMVAGIVLILFFIGLLYLTNNKITSLNDLEKITSVPVLGVVPISQYSSDLTFHVIDHPKSRVSESIRTLRTNLDFFNILSAHKVIAISSTVSGEGKSFVAMNLGCVMALSKKRVIILDLDMRKPKMNLPSSFNDKTKGVSTILIRKNSWQECLVKTSQDNFDYIPSGPHPPNPSELLLNGEFSSMLEELKKDYDFIILDTPPVGLVTDGIMAMKRADISIYIFRANYSKKDFILNLQRIININKFSTITTVLNALPILEQSYGYGYYEEGKGRSWLRSIFKRSV